MQTRRFLMGFLASAFMIAIAASACVAADEVQLQLRLKEGQSYRLRITGDTKMTQTLQGQRQEVKEWASFGYVFDVQSVDANGDAAIKVTHQTMQFREDGPAGRVELDSTKPGAKVPPLLAGMAAIVGQSFTMKIAPTGTIRALQGGDEMVRQAAKSLSTLEEPWKTSMTKLLEDHFGNLALRGAMGGLFSLYPDKPVAVGERWSKSLTSTRGRVEAFCKITERKDGVSFIKVYSVITPDENAVPVQMGLASVKSAISGKEEGTMEVEEATGMIVRFKTSGEASGSMKLITQAGEMPIPTTLAGSTTMERF